MLPFILLSVASCMLLSVSWHSLNIVSSIMLSVSRPSDASVSSTLLFVNWPLVVYSIRCRSVKTMNVQNAF